MKRAAIALAGLLTRIAGAVGLEGTFLIIGTALLAAGSSYLSPAGPLLVVGGICVLTAIALARPAGR